MEAIAIEPRLRQDLAEVVRRRVDAGDVEDVVQATLLEVVAADARPDSALALWHFTLFVARQKIADLHRRRARDRRFVSAGSEDVDEEPAEATESVHELLDWASRTARAEQDERARRTLHWMLREGDGEELADIAKDEDVPPAFVRQRVSRMRRFLRERWMREVAVAGAILAVLVVAFLAYSRAHRSAIAVEAAPAPSAVATVSAAPEASASPGVQRVKDAPLTNPSAAAIPSSVPSAPATPSAAPATSGVKPKPKAAPSEVPSFRYYKPSCDPPYMVDSTGQKRYRVECL